MQNTRFLPDSQFLQDVEILYEEVSFQKPPKSRPVFGGVGLAQPILDKTFERVYPLDANRVVCIQRLRIEAFGVNPVFLSQLGLFSQNGKSRLSQRRLETPDVLPNYLLDFSRFRQYQAAGFSATSADSELAFMQEFELNDIELYFKGEIRITSNLFTKDDIDNETVRMNLMLQGYEFSENAENGALLSKFF
jgi:hypothetical protein